MLSTVVDDFFDIGGSLAELENLIQLVEKYVSLFPCSLLSSAFFGPLHFCLQKCDSLICATDGIPIWLLIVVPSMFRSYFLHFTAQSVKLEPRHSHSRDAM